jgi:hypothetical protein
MIRALRAAPVFAAFLGVFAELAPSAWACGGFFAQEIEVAPDQTIIVAHRAGLETYIFRPRFCGAAKDFGVILPIPATLSTSPTLADNALYDQLDQYTAPEKVEVCASSGGGIGCGGASKGDFGQAGGLDAGMGVDVVDRGRVGNFDYAILKADTVNAFTDWLDQNGFPHGSGGSDAYQHYVTKQWYFVAFKVHADTAAPPTGMKLCGDLGPIELTFPAPQIVVPARIASVNAASGGMPKWRVVLVAASQQKLASGSPFSQEVYFSNSLRQADLETYPALAGLAQGGERLTVLNVTFPWGGASDDVNIADDSRQADFRTKRNVYKDCSGGCATGGTVATNALLAAAVLGLLGAARRGIRGPQARKRG